MHKQVAGGNIPPVKQPENTVEYPACPNQDVGTRGCDFSCWNCTRTEDIVTCPTKNDWALTYDDGPRYVLLLHACIVMYFK